MNLAHMSSKRGYLRPYEFEMLSCLSNVNPSAKLTFHSNPKSWLSKDADRIHF